METSASFEARSAPPPYPAETSVGHGGPKRARSRKRRIEAKESLQPTESPLLGGAFDPGGSSARILL